MLEKASVPKAATVVSALNSTAPGVEVSNTEPVSRSARMATWMPLSMPTPISSGRTSTLA